MTLLDLILKTLGDAASEVKDIKVVLALVVAKFPDTGAVLNPIIAALDAPVTPESLAALGPVLLKEALDIAQGKIDGRDHAGDDI